MVLLARVRRILTRARSWYHAHACASSRARAQVVFAFAFALAFVDSYEYLSGGSSTTHFLSAPHTSAVRPMEMRLLRGD